jgi:hypothetical protein
MSSQFLSEAVIGRRAALAALSGLCAGGMAQPAAARPRNRRATLDWSDPRDNLYAFGKIWSGYDGPVIGGFHGLMYARLPGQRLIPLFGYEGTGVLEAKIAENGDLMIKSRETGYFTDLRTREVLEFWDNPFTGERVEVYHFYNDLLAGRLSTEIPTFVINGDVASKTRMNEGTMFPDANGKYPFILPFEQFGDDIALAWDYAHAYRNPVTPEGWPKASTGARITPSEHFTFVVNREEVEDRGRPTARMRAGFSRQSEPWPWMRMGGHALAKDMVVFGRMTSLKGLKGVDDVPRKVLIYIEKNAPHYLEMPPGWGARRNVRLDTWSCYAMDVPPEVTGGAPWSKRTDLLAPPPTGLGAKTYR